LAPKAGSLPNGSIFGAAFLALVDFPDLLGHPRDDARETIRKNEDLARKTTV
jgi:hypothetical protein